MRPPASQIGPKRRPQGRRWTLAGALTLVLVAAGAGPLAPALAQTQPSPSVTGQIEMEARPGPRVMLCLYDADGHRLAGSAQCPVVARPEDAMMPEAHCFYDREGRLWRGLPRCPRIAPPFLMDEAAQAR